MVVSRHNGQCIGKLCQLLARIENDELSAYIMVSDFTATGHESTAAIWALWCVESFVIMGAYYRGSAYFSGRLV